jgi:hypothetical protein
MLEASVDITAGGGAAAAAAAGGGAAATIAGAGESPPPPPPRAFNMDMRALLGSGEAGVGVGGIDTGAAAAGCCFSLVEVKEGDGPKRSDSASTTITGWGCLGVC